MADAHSAADAHVHFAPMTGTGATILGTGLAAIDPWARYAYTPAALTAYLGAHEPDAPRFEILLEREIAGAVGIRRNWLRGPYLQLLGVLPEFQNHGVGERTLVWFETEARSYGAQNLWVAASDFNARALAFYERHDFVRVATLADLVAPDSAEILLRKRLAYC